MAHEDVLALVNAARALVGAPPLTELPKGEPENGCECPLARALTPLEAFVENDRIYLDFRNPEIAARLGQKWTTRVHPKIEYVVFLPEVLKEFIGAFDSGAYPELIDTSAMVVEANDVD